jgi:hypothetical protein
MWDAKIYCCVSMQIPVFDSQFGKLQDMDTLWKQKQNYLGFVVPFHQSVLIFNQ